MLSPVQPIRLRLPGLPLRFRSWLARGAAERPWNEEEFLPQLPDLDDILTEPPPRLLRNVHYVVATLLVTLVIIASLVKVDIIVAASGRLITDAPTIVVQPLQISIIRSVRVKPGDVVHKGDIVATLDPTFTGADRATLSAQQSAKRAEIARLDAELNATPLTLDEAAPDNRLQATLYRERQSQYAAKMQGFDEDLQRHREAIRATQENRASLLKQIEIYKEVEQMRADLFKIQTGSKLNYLDAQASRMRAEREFQDTDNHLNEVQHMLRSTEADRQGFIDGWRREILEDLAKARTDAGMVGDSLTKATRMDDLVVLTAPEDGIVLEVAKRSVGSVLQQAEPLVTLVPSDAPLIAEVMIGSGDVGYTKPGQEVAIKVDAFPYQRHGMLTGRLRSVGEDSSGGGVAPPGQSASGLFHRSQVELTDATLHALPEGAHLIPGMTLTGEIKVGTRSVISYFLNPISRGFSESVREP